MRYVLAALLVLVGGPGRKRERCEAAVIGVANFRVGAEKSDGYQAIEVYGLEHFPK
jgi:hypothetical protein